MRETLPAGQRAKPSAGLLGFMKYETGIVQKNKSEALSVCVYVSVSISYRI